MKKTTKLLLIMLIVGFCGTAVMMGYIIGSGQMMSHEATEDYVVESPINVLDVHTVAAQVTVLPSETVHVEAYAKAWLPGPVNMNEVVDVRVNNGVLTVTEIPFPAEFLGLFPQPYEMKLTIYVPQKICDAYEEET